MKFIENIGRGGFGTVDLVEDEAGQKFARKTFSINQPGYFPPDLAENVKRRFVREANVQAALSHSNIMPVLETDLDSDPPSFLMPVAVSTLDKDLQRDSTLGGQPLRAIMDILSGLEELHSMGITHRDLKPMNVLRVSENNSDRYVISDFGLMSIKDTQLSVLTQTGMKMGSDYYTAPEIVADLRMASPQSDIYSVGCIIHDIFGSGNRIPCNEIVESGYYADLMLCCTRQSPSRRFSSVSDLREAILSLGQTATVATEPQITDFINMLNSSQAIDGLTWERIIRKAEITYPAHDAKALLSRISLGRINELVEQNAPLGARLGNLYATWVKESAFNFEECDGIANRLQAFLKSPDVSCQAEAVLALLLMGTTHNRWYVERKFLSLCGPDMPLPVAKRIAMEIRVMRGRACIAVSHLERSIGVSRNSLHPIVLESLNQVCR